MAGKNSFNVKVTISDDISSVKEPVGEQDWVGNKEFDIDKNYSDESRWYKGDFHTHTRLSDGKETTRSAMKKAEQMGMALEYKPSIPAYMEMDIF